LNAAPFFFNNDPDIPADQKVPQLHREIIGGTVGGALIKDKLFGFIGYQHLHVSDQELGYSRFSVPVGLSDDRSAERPGERGQYRLVPAARPQPSPTMTARLARPSPPASSTTTPSTRQQRGLQPVQRARRQRRTRQVADSQSDRRYHGCSSV
jgi:hypothetical protein